MHRRMRQITLSSGIAAIVLTIAGFVHFAARQKSASISPVSNSERSSSTHSRPSKFRHQSFNDYTLWWDDIPEPIRAEGSPSGAAENIHRQDYAGPDACKNCHKKQYESWSHHPHRWMNSLVENTTVHGDFNDHRMPYMGGEVLFRKSEDQYRMRLERGEIRREYVVEQTIGSRYFQYYVGRQLEGPEQPNHPVYSEAHVLPLGYWLDRQEWLPIVHVHPEVQEGERHDPFVPRPAFLEDMNHYADQTNILYRSQCNFCHTTFPLGDTFLRFQRTIGRHVPTLVDVSLTDYVQSARPQLWPAGRSAAEMSQDDSA